MKQLLSVLCYMASILCVFAQETRWSIKPMYDEASSFTNGVAYVTSRDSLLFIDKKGTILRRYSWQELGWFSEGFISVKVGGKYGYLNLAGEIVIKPRFTWTHPFVEGIASVLENGLMGSIDKTGKYVIPLKYHALDDVSEGLISAQIATTKKWGYIDKTGKMVIPFMYDNVKNAAGALPFSEGLAAVYLNKKAGYIDKTGKTIIPHQFGQGNSFSGGYAEIYNPDGRRVIDRTGKFVNAEPAETAKPKPSIKTDPRFPGVEAVGNASEGLMPARRNGKWGYVNVE